MSNYMASKRTKYAVSLDCDYFSIQIIVTVFKTEFWTSVATTIIIINLVANEIGLLDLGICTDE